MGVPIPKLPAALPKSYLNPNPNWVPPPKPKGGWSASGARADIAKQKVASFFDELEKIAEWDSKKFREGLIDEGIPLAGATIGARYGGLRGAALGYAAGGTASLARSYAKGEKPSLSRKLLAAGALGYGAGGGAHALLEHASKGAKAGKGILGKIRHGFHAGKGSSPKLRRTVEEALPAAGATLATGVAMGTSGGKKDKEKKAMLKMALAPVLPLLGGAVARIAGGAAARAVGGTAARTAGGALARKAAPTLARASSYAGAVPTPSSGTPPRDAPV